MEPKKVLRTHNLIDGIGLWHHFNGAKSERRSILESGYVWMPYIPLVEEPFAPRRGILSRYARTVVNNRFYGNINISEL